MADNRNRPARAAAEGEAPGPLTALSNQMTASLFSLLRVLAQWVRESAEERPLISLLLGVEVGFAVARAGGAAPATLSRSPVVDLMLR